MTTNLEEMIKQKPTEFIPYNYEEILTKVQQRFTDKGYTSVTESRSNSNNLSMILTGILSDLTVNMNNNIKESILTTAFQENNIMESAKLFGYERTRNISYVYEISLSVDIDDTLDPLNETKREYRLEKYSEFIAGDKKYYYMGNTITRLISNKDITENDDEHKIIVEVHEGTLYKYEDHNTLNYTTQKGDTEFNIIFDNIAANGGIDLFISYVDEHDTIYNKQLWKESTNMLIETANITDTQYQNYIVIENKVGYTIKWNMAESGYKLPYGSLLNVNVLVSSGSKGEALTPIEPSGVLTMIKLTEGFTQKILIKGVDKESKFEVRENAPKFNNLANRLITIPDYIAASNRRPEVFNSTVWSSSVEIPQFRKGSFFSFIPATRTNSYNINDTKTTFNRIIDNNEIIELSQVNDVFNSFESLKIPTLKHYHNYPVYMDFDISIKVVNYDPSLSIIETNINVFTTVSEYFKWEIENFLTTFFKSNLIKRVNETITDKSGSIITILNTIKVNNYNFNKLDKDVDGELTCIIPLSYNFEYPFDILTNELDTTKLPTISSENFITIGDSVSVDFTNKLIYEANSYEEDNIIVKEYEYFNILLETNGNEEIIGKYILVRDNEEYIRVELYANEDTVGVTDRTPLILSNFSEDMGDNINNVLNINYNENNMYFSKNTIPRLKNITFN